MLLACLFAADCLAATTGVKPLSAYELTYGGRAQGFDIKTVRKLEYKGERYTLRQTSSAMMMQTTELSEFSVDAPGNFTPHSFLYQRKILGNNRVRQTFFYPARKLAIYTDNNGTPQHVTLPADTYDVFSYQEKLRQELQASQNRFLQRSLNVLERDKVRQHSYRHVANVWLRTPLGYLRTQKIERVRENSEKSTTIWLARDWDYVIVKITHRETGEPDYTMKLTGGTVGSRLIQGLKEIPLKPGK